MGIVSGGGGGSFNGGTITRNLDVQVPSDAHVRVRIDGDHNATVDTAVSDAGAGKKDAAVNVEADGGGTAQVFVIDNNGVGESVVIDGRGTVDAFVAAGSKTYTAWDATGSTLRYALLPAGQPMLGVNAAPADADLAANQCALWFDPTNGASKLMVKAKQADGTVKTAAVALA